MSETRKVRGGLCVRGGLGRGGLGGSRGGAWVMCLRTRVFAVWCSPPAHTRSYLFLGTRVRVCTHTRQKPSVSCVDVQTCPSPTQQHGAWTSWTDGCVPPEDTQAGAGTAAPSSEGDTFTNRRPCTCPATCVLRCDSVSWELPPEGPGVSPSLPPSLGRPCYSQVPLATGAPTLGVCVSSRHGVKGPRLGR